MENVRKSVDCAHVTNKKHQLFWTKRRELFKCKKLNFTEKWGPAGTADAALACSRRTRRQQTTPLILLKRKHQNWKPNNYLQTFELHNNYYQILFKWKYPNRKLSILKFSENGKYAKHIQINF